MTHLKQSPIFHSKCKIDKGLITGGRKYIIEIRDARAGSLWPTPYTFIHSFIHSFILHYLVI
jgi:hypothetical protein